VNALVLLEGGWFNRRDLPPAADAPVSPFHAEALAHLFDSNSSEAWPRVADAGTPVLAVAGLQGDDGRRPGLLDAFRAAVPHATVLVFPHAGHDLLRDAPVSIATRVASWLNGLARR
jgi:pimeloyl-ACP methyl ester carboxylesterase